MLLVAGVSAVSAEGVAGFSCGWVEWWQRVRKRRDKSEREEKGACDQGEPPHG